MRDLILGLSLLFFGPAGPGLVDLPPPPGIEFGGPPRPKPEAWPREVIAARAARRAARSAARQRNRAMLGAIGAQLDAQAGLLAARSAAETAAYHHRMANLLSVQGSPPIVYRGPACDPCRPSSARWDCTPGRSSLCPPGRGGPSPGRPD